MSEICCTVQNVSTTPPPNNPYPGALVVKCIKYLGTCIRLGITSAGRLGITRTGRD